MNAQALKRAIKRIPGEEGWWKSEGQEKFQAHAERLITLGMTPEEAVEFLTDLYWTTAGEFGS